MKFTKSAFDRLVGYLSRRDHSVRELTQKLVRYHEFDDVAEAIRKADRLKLLPDPNVFAQKLTRSLLARGKGRRYISAYLQKKGLPKVELSRDEELIKGRDMVQRQLGYVTPYSFQQKQKIYRYLNNRGFDPKMIMQVMNEK